MALKITVNSSPYVVSADSATSLLYILRNDLGLNGPKFGCGLGQCGACKVLVGNQAIASCSLALGGIGDQGNITTLAQITAEKLDVKFERIRMRPNDTAHYPYAQVHQNS